MKRKWKWIFLAPLAILGIVLFIFIGGESVRLLWNWLLPPIFGWREITFWQALGLLALCRILFGGLGSGSGRSRFGRRMREGMEDRCAQMTPEERDRFRQGIRRRFGFGPSTSESKEPSSHAGGAPSNADV
jgi:hypothetical protein